MSYLNKITDMYAMMGQGKMMDAFEKYYHDDVVMIEATGEIRKGKDTNRESLINWMKTIKEHHGGGLDAITSNEEAKTTMVENWGEFTFQDGNKVKMEEVCVQKWDGDLIVEERFYYNPASMAPQG